MIDLIANMDPITLFSGILGLVVGLAWWNLYP